MVKVKDYQAEHEISIICDGCGQEFCDSEGFSSWGKSSEYDTDDVVAHAVRNDIDYNEYGWNYTDEGEDYCPRCAHYSSEYLDRLVVHPLPQKIKNIIALNNTLRDGVTTLSLKDGKVSLPVDLVRVIKGMLYQYALSMTIANSEYHEAKALCDDYDCNRNETKTFLDEWKSSAFLKLNAESLKNIVGKYQDEKC